MLFHISNRNRICCFWFSLYCVKSFLFCSIIDADFIYLNSSWSSLESQKLVNKHSSKIRYIAHSSLRSWYGQSFHFWRTVVHTPGFQIFRSLGTFVLRYTGVSKSSVPNCWECFFTTFSGTCKMDAYIILAVVFSFVMRLMYLQQAHFALPKVVIALHFNYPSIMCNAL